MAFISLPGGDTPWIRPPGSNPMDDVAVVNVEKILFHTFAYADTQHTMVIYNELDDFQLNQMDEDTRPIRTDPSDEPYVLDDVCDENNEIKDILDIVEEIRWSFGIMLRQEGPGDVVDLNYHEDLLVDDQIKTSYCESMGSLSRLDDPDQAYIYNTRETWVSSAFLKDLNWYEKMRMRLSIRTAQGTEYFSYCWDVKFHPKSNLEKVYLGEATLLVSPSSHLFSANSRNDSLKTPSHRSSLSIESFVEVPSELSSSAVHYVQRNTPPAHIVATRPNSQLNVFQQMGYALPFCSTSFIFIDTGCMALNLVNWSRSDSIRIRIRQNCPFLQLRSGF